MLITANQDLHDVSRGDIDVSNSSEVVIYGIHEGDINIRPNCSVIVHGIVNGSICCLPNANCAIHGIVNGDLIDSGLFVLYGILNTDSGIPCKIRIFKGAVINGHTY